MPATITGGVVGAGILQRGSYLVIRDEGDRYRVSCTREQAIAALDRAGAPRTWPVRLTPRGLRLERDRCDICGAPTGPDCEDCGAREVRRPAQAAN